MIFVGVLVFAVHRLAYEHFKGQIPEGQDVMHSCDFPPCWNPSHLVAGTHASNMADMATKGRGRKAAR